MSVSVNPPKTPVTKGSNGVACATIPNVCKMPGPPAPFVPVPLPNIGKSGDSPKGYTKKVKVQGKAVAIKGATFKSMGDIASKGTGGGLISANTHGPTKFVGPGSLNVKFEGKNVHVLSDPMLNNCGGSGSPPNSATMMGVLQMTGMIVVPGRKCPVCRKARHEALKEVEDTTKPVAGDLASDFGSRLPKNSEHATMIGVVQCKCATPRYYGDKSGSAEYEAFAAAALNRDIYHRKSYKNQLESRLIAYLGESKRYLVQKTIRKAKARRKMAMKGKSVYGYQVGKCAGPGALLALLSDGGVPFSLTEQWFSAQGASTQEPITYIDARGTKPTRVPGQFAHGESVPPCGTCIIILPLMLCHMKESKCSHPGSTEQWIVDPNKAKSRSKK